MFPGSKIIKSSFDFDTSQIGPYTLPIKLNLAVRDKDNKIPIYRLYEEMLFHTDSIAVFNVNNYCICVVTPTQALQVPAYRDRAVRDLLEWKFTYRITNKIYQHIGYVKTYQQCLAVTEMPEYLILDTTKVVPEGFNSMLEATPRLNPPLTLYRELVNSDADAVYIADATGEPRFLYK